MCLFPGLLLNLNEPFGKSEVLHRWTHGLNYNKSELVTVEGSALDLKL